MQEIWNYLNYHPQYLLLVAIAEIIIIPSIVLGIIALLRRLLDVVTISPF